ncbi:GNAT family N-acetyltransferase [Gimesia sp.]|uniref:GNAT family N-acetyltransferase n=1 Tax=Gimesia sp. TaxID=2024833 RepID=UPI003A9119CE
MSVKIRMATTEQDVETAIELGRALHAESQFRDMPYNPDKLRALGTKVLSGNHGYLLILAERDGVATGFILAKLDRHFFSDALAVNILVFYVHATARGGVGAIKLMHGVRKWAQKNSASKIYVNATSRIQVNRIHKLMTRIGFEFCGGNYSFSVA